MQSPSEALSEYLRSQSSWRGMKAEEYPEDERNAQSSTALESLADYVASGEADVLVAALEPHMFEGVTLGGEETARAISRYGFGYPATSSTQHDAFLEELAVLCLVDAYEFARDAGEGYDPTDTLHPHELDAARDGGFLPHRYFERRGKMTENAQEEWIAAEHDGERSDGER